MKLKRTPLTPASSSSFNPASVMLLADEGDALGLAVGGDQRIDQRAVVGVVAGRLHDHVLVEAEEVAQRCNSVSFGASQGVYLRLGANGNFASGPNTWQCASTAPAGGLYFGFDGLGWNGM